MKKCYSWWRGGGEKEGGLVGGECADVKNGSYKRENGGKVFFLYNKKVSKSEIEEKKKIN